MTDLGFFKAGLPDQTDRVGEISFGGGLGGHWSGLRFLDVDVGVLIYICVKIGKQSMYYRCLILCVSVLMKYEYSI